jgi:hypothetical protein
MRLGVKPGLAVVAVVAGEGGVFLVRLAGVQAMVEAAEQPVDRLRSAAGWASPAAHRRW